ncbi:HTH-type transcriptional repressor KstR2 [Brevundimonas diminuta]|uniref:TetR/AcrR family transcriptional regulator n=1 Tax=Brevundimonas TaxID=41275 RepID=UPI000207F474|nr:TetR/AcrR family transcriptional regulator [Brevundimonas diminuta]EGF96189.1 bacterial regulatory protein, tetR family protein [Brevundimonas diminuta ATCC 11568]OWR16835.1 TetR family transcriptional regulator [Brevundimonas diminuta]WQE44928.1 TetR/AcrR family transcriptional regulator [Brevundimonas diminuta]SPU45350.1 HTH-type transcriptional repressor KstR2 [Brevundimonas diminuta]SUW17446.1 HTH-type transcriptional repressor KstR2 [Brevundimonas diminuta]
MRESSQSAPAVAEAEVQPRLNRRQAAKVRTRQKVLDAARTLFAERGYDAATIRDIAKGAGMSTGAVFANFQDKAELFEAVFSEEMEGLLLDIRTAAAEGRVLDRLSNGLTAGYHRSLDHLPLMQAMVARSWFQPEDADLRSRAFVRPLVEAVAEILQAGVREGELRQDVDLPMLARLIWDVFINNFRFAAYDNWGIEELTPHIRKQLELILSSQLARQ